MAYNYSFGQWLVTRRKELHLQRTELAAQIGCAAITLRKIECDERRPSQQLALLLAERLNLAPHHQALFVQVARGELPAERLSALPLLHTAGPLPDTASHPISRTPLPTNLPAPLTSFVGRDAELDTIPALVQAHRLITLTGVGGVGKTRLAIEVGMRLVQTTSAAPARDGIWLVELAALAQPTLVAQAIARLFQIPEQAGRSPRELLQEYLAEKQLLLILDNCEHVVDVCAELAEYLLHHCWQLRILATSREPLRIPGEVAYPVVPLTLPAADTSDLHQLLSTTAAQLFVARMGTYPSEQTASRTSSPARAHAHHQQSPSTHSAIANHDASAIAQICRQLDGIPLALELAAPLSHSMPLAEIANQLQNQMAILTNSYRTAIPRHQTMHSALVWSYRLLGPAEQVLLASVSIFAGGWTLEAAQAICVDDPPERTQLMLIDLMTKSLVLQEESHGQWRYRLLEPVRQFALVQLQASGAAVGARNQHLDYMLACSEHVAPKLGDNELFSERSATQFAEERVTDQVRLYARHADELANIRCALDWAAETGLIDKGLRLLIATGQLFILHAGQQELMTRFRAMLEAQVPPRDALTYARACLWVVYIAQRQGEFDVGRFWLAKSETLIAHLDNSALQFSIRFLQTQDAQLRGDYALAHIYLDEQKHLALANNYFGMSKELVEDALVRSAGFLLLAEGDYLQAKLLCRENHARHLKVGNIYSSTGMSRLLGYALLYSGDVDEAGQRFRESLLGNISFGDKQAIAACLAAWAAYALINGQFSRAACLFGASESLREAICTPLMAWDTEQVQRNVITLRQKLAAPELEAQWEIGHTMSLEQAIDYALVTHPSQ